MYLARPAVARAAPLQALRYRNHRTSISCHQTRLQLCCGSVALFEFFYAADEDSFMQLMRTEIGNLPLKVSEPSWARSCTARSEIGWVRQALENNSAFPSREKGGGTRLRRQKMVRARRLKSTTCYSRVYSLCIVFCC